MSEQSIIIFDVETTGTNPQSDQVIELCVQFGLAPDAESRTWRILPDVPISAGAQNVHGISMDDLKDEPKFEELSDELWSLFSDADVLIGYNVDFDINFMIEEFKRMGKEDLPLKDKSLVDPYHIWRKNEPRNLSAACERFAGRKLDAAHSASADVRATADVLVGMKTAFDLEDADWKTLAEISGLSRDSWIGPSKHLLFKDSKVVIGFGKHKFKSIIEVASEDGGSYLDWILKKDFPAHVKEILKDAPRSTEEELFSWVTERYSTPS